tara:strand:+ start:94 stop:564 length:471 start_codon:yes stop_codon:yes gene_type:complete
MKNKIFTLLIIVFSFLSSQIFAEGNKPLLMAGKENLYKRVLSIPGSALYKSPYKETKSINPFTALYVYKEKKVNNQDWLKVGIDRHGKTIGWMRQKDTIQWNQGLTVAFRDAKKIIGRFYLKMRNHWNLLLQKKIYENTKTSTEMLQPEESMKNHP